jgi:hypothetical protein
MDWRCRPWNLHFLSVVSAGPLPLSSFHCHIQGPEALRVLSPACWYQPHRLEQGLARDDTTNQRVTTCQGTHELALMAYTVNQRAS